MKKSKRTSIFLSQDLIVWLDEGVKCDLFANRSHGIRIGNSFYEEEDA
jgi:Arc/MetJ-type ribon-helix-helix transcriptional regulator